MPEWRGVFAAKLLAPRIGAKLIERPRLQEMFAGYENRKITLISAPGGYGKTVLALQFAAKAGVPVIWYHLDSFDNDFPLFVRHLIAGIEEHIPGFGNEAAGMASLAEGPVDTRRLVTIFVNELALRADGRLIIVLDDYHVIEESSIHQFVDGILEYMPSGIHILIASRTHPPLRLLRHKVAGTMVEITREHLQFDRSEIAEFLVSGAGRPVSDETIAVIEEETGGWAAALRLATYHLSLVEARRKAAAARGFRSKREIYDYLAGEVLDQQPDPVKSFLLGSSVLEFVTPAICDNILDRHDSQEMLQLLERRNLFITALGGEEYAYCYHQVFREFLLSRLGERRKALQERAGDYCMSTGMPARAIGYFLAACLYDKAVTALEEAGPWMLRHGSWQAVKRWLGEIPDKYLAGRPWIDILNGAVKACGGRLEEALSDIERAGAAFEAAGDERGLTQALLHKARILRSQGDFAESLRLLDQALPGIMRLPPAERHEMAIEQASALALKGAPDEAIIILREALNEAENARDGYVIATIAEKLAELYYVKGEYSRAIEVHQRGVEMSPDPEITAYSVRDSIATIYRDWGDLDQALECAKRGIEVKEKLGLVEALPYAYHQIATIYVDLGRFAEAEENYVHAIGLARRSKGEAFFLALSLALYGRCLALQGKLAEGRRQLDEALTLAGSQSEYILAICQEVAAPIYIAMGDVEEGRRMFGESLAVLERIGAKFPLCIAYGTLAGILPDFMNDIIRRLGDDGRNILMELTSHESPGVRCRAVRLLAESGGEDVRGAIQRLLYDQDERVKDQALLALQELRTAANMGDASLPASESMVALETETAKEQGRCPIEVTCLGPFRAFATMKGDKELSWRTTKARDLLACLVHHHGSPVAREKLLEDLWPEADLERASTLLHTSLYRLRKALREASGVEDPILYAGGYYHLVDRLISSDVERFERLVEKAMGGSVSPADRVAMLERAADMFQGEYLQNIGYEWVVPERERLNRIYREVKEALARQHMDAGQYSKAASHLRTILQFNPLLEEIHCLLMIAYAKMGDRMAVMQQFETLVDILQKELGVDPSPRTRELYYGLCGEEP